MMPVCEGRGGFGKSVPELAMEYVLLQDERPNRPRICNDPSEVDIYKDHMHQEYLRYEEMIRRVGIDNTIVAIKQAKDTLTMVGL